MKTPTMRGVISTLALAGMVLFPAAASANHNPEYSGTADSTAAVSCTIDPVTGEQVCGTVAENTVSANSEGGIIPDQAGTPQNEANDTSVATATPVRVETSDGTRANPDSIAAVAPNDADGTSNTGVETVGDGNGNVAASTEGTHSEVSAHSSSNESTIDTWSSSVGVDSTVGAGDARVVVPNLASDSWINRTPNGDIWAGAANVAFADGAQQVSLFGGFITADFVSASSTSFADGAGTSDNTINFSVDNLSLNNAPWGASLIMINHADNFLNEAVTVIDATIDGVTDTFTTATGSDLLNRNTYADSAALFNAYLGILAQLNNLTGINGDLEGLSLRLGGGWSDNGDGDYARGMSQAVRAHAWLGGEWESDAIVGYAYSGVDAVRAFSTATDPLWPAGWTPVVDADRAFPATRNAFPVSHVFATGPWETGTAVLGTNDLPRTGLEIGTLVLFGLILVAGGIGTRRFGRAAA